MRATIFDFALAYGNLSAAGSNRRQLVLAALSTPVFARTFEQPASVAAFESTRGLPSGAKMAARVASIELGPRQGNYDHAVVILQQALQQPSGSTEQPVGTTFDVDALRIGSAWRVASFTAQP